MSTHRFASIDLLRGIAALMVTMFHLSNGNSNFLHDNFWFKKLFSGCWSGVEMFFVISGFIIPFSMKKKAYKLNKAGNFLLKRIFRIDPPYFLSIFLIVGLNFLSTLSNLYKGQPFTFNYFDVLLHFGYLCGFFNKPWINPVYWTLAIEFQYYLLIALFFPLISDKRISYFLLAFMLVLGLSFLFKQNFLVFKYLPYFLLGIVVFKKFENQLNVSISLSLIFALLIIIYNDGLNQTIVSFFAVSMILYGNKLKSKFFAFFGTISYSLYLLHVPIGGRVINMSINFVHSDNNRLFVVLFALLLSSLVAYIYYLIVERPFLYLSSNIRL